MITVKDLLSFHLEDTFSKEGWHPPLATAVWGLTAEQASWKPGPERHSIWQIVRHVIKWKRGVLEALAGDPPDYERMTAEDWPEASDDQGAWEADVRALHDIYAGFRQYLEVNGEEGMQRAVPSYRQSSRPAPVARRLLNAFTHDAYHTGQIQYLRALQGIPVDRLFTAAWDGNVPRVREILDAHPRLINVHNGDGWTPLHVAAFAGQPAVVGLLLDRGAEVNARSQNDEARTALHAATTGWQAAHRAAAASLLLERGVDREAVDAEGNTALHLAAQAGESDLIELLLRHGAAVNTRRGDGKTPLGVAAGAGRTRAAELLRRSGGAE